jgi:hypothetical protein
LSLKGSHVVESKRNGIVVVVMLLVAILSILTTPEVGLARQASNGESARVRVLHGIADAGPLDIYIDGRIALIGIQFLETSGDLALSRSDHQFAIVPTGDAVDNAIAAGTLNLQDRDLAYAALLGTSADASVGLFSVDDRPVDEGRARFRVISGIADADSVVPTFVGGDAISEPLSFGDASEYAAIDAGTYDLDILDAASGSSLLSVSQVPLTEGTITDIFLVGSLSDGTQQAAVVAISSEIARIPGSRAQIVAGNCESPDTELADLGLVRVGQGDAVGAPNSAEVAQGYAVAAVPFSTLIQTPHAIAISDEANSARFIACGDIGGRLTDTGSLVISLQADGSDLPDGIAVLAPTLENPDATGVSIFLVIGTTVGPAGTPAAEA